MKNAAIPRFELLGEVYEPFDGPDEPLVELFELSSNLVGPSTASTRVSARRTSLSSAS